MSTAELMWLAAKRLLKMLVRDMNADLCSDVTR